MQKSGNTINVKVDDGKYGKMLELEIKGDELLADTSAFSSGSGLGTKTYPKLFDLAKSQGLKYRPGNLLEHNDYRYPINIMKYRDAGNDISHIYRSPSSDEIVTDKYLSRFAGDILERRKSGEKLNMSAATIKLLQKFKDFQAHK